MSAEYRVDEALPSADRSPAIRRERGPLVPPVT